MGTGKPGLKGKARASIVGGILTSEPVTITALRPTSLLELNRLIRTALAKNPDERWQSARDVGILLDSIATTRDQSKKRSLSLWQTTIGLLTLVALALVAFLIFRTANATPRLLRLAIPLPANARFSSLAKLLAISPHGVKCAFTAVDRIGP